MIINNSIVNRAVFLGLWCSTSLIYLHVGGIVKSHVSDAEPHRLYIIIIMTKCKTTCWIMRASSHLSVKMLSPSSPAKKNLSEEDSSGSDAGSEVGQEPETDRFGFIVTNGSTAGWADPRLCLCTVTVLSLSLELLLKPGILVLCFPSPFGEAVLFKSNEGWGGCWD